MTARPLVGNFTYSLGGPDRHPALAREQGVNSRAGAAAVMLSEDNGELCDCRGAAEDLREMLNRSESRRALGYFLEEFSGRRRLPRRKR